MLTICGWCDKFLSGEETGDGLVSHGICLPCMERTLKESGEKMSKHTPGPWQVNQMTSPRGGWVLAKDPRGPIDGDLVAICATCYQQHDDDAQYANARLIAAAPEMYIVCQMLKDDPGLTDSALELVREALAKAEGRS